MDREEDAGARLTNQLTEIGDRYLRRTLSEMNELSKLHQHVRQGDTQAFTAIQQLAHRIHGSGAMFGFDALSDAAGAVEHLLLRDHDRLAQPSAELLTELGQKIERLDEQARTTAKARNLL